MNIIVHVIIFWSLFLCLVLSVILYCGLLCLLRGSANGFQASGSGTWVLMVMLDDIVPSSKNELLFCVLFVFMKENTVVHSLLALECGMVRTEVETLRSRLNTGRFVLGIHLEFKYAHKASSRYGSSGSRPMSVSTIEYQCMTTPGRLWTAQTMSISMSWNK